MSTAREIIEGKIVGWRQWLDQLTAQRRKLEEEIVQNERMIQQNLGAIQGASELLALLPADAPAVVGEAEAEADASDGAQ